MNKDKHLRIRITERQLRLITELIIEEEKTKSELIREIIDDYIKICRKTNKSNLSEIKKTIQDLNNNNPIFKF